MSDAKKKLSDEKRKEFIEILDKNHSAMMKLNYEIFFLLLPSILILGIIFIFVKFVNIYYLYKIILSLIFVGVGFYFFIFKKLKTIFDELKIYSNKRKEIIKKMKY